MVLRSEQSLLAQLIAIAHGAGVHDVQVDLRRPNFQPLVRPGYYR